MLKEEEEEEGERAKSVRKRKHIILSIFNLGFF
jgi:hypothetical protein